MVEPIFDYQFRIIIIGNSTVGKSSLLKYFTDGRFAEVSDPTVGVDFFARLLQVEDGTRIKLQLWDTAGQERFRSITKSYFRNSVGVLLVYDICCRKSFENVSNWMVEAKSHIEPHRAVFILVGCKLDLKDQRQVSTEEAARFADFNEMPFVETSAKTGENVEEAFRIVGQEIYNRVQLGEYSIHDGWDGVKAGYRRAGRDYGLVEAEAAKTTCC
ncbi:ras-related protein Rab-39B-like [Daphnia carinata]|uniref:ras-related protein Rab-39B-like n=1 Tax=Daphnia carinata TaxID=120202 RepID=UPI00257BDBBC|nr:ras-related protein Rab-39B-like [Daphnia carinata]